ncbi:hypothetical protein [Glutamicibacter sp.]|jgi:hypothetical protein|uniref:hypothetical protein n=1 Tax=Glutamicibacter sp. TaxID=1931995 RepID=UPI002B487286|nr:hypothetical protein [Glutamicibacter sp.]HJX77171.1 hypothetical protein [Glutamicibacter sp.]
MNGSELGLTAGEPRAVVGAHSIDETASNAAEASGVLLLSAGQCFELRAPKGKPALLIFPSEAHVLSDGWPGMKVADEEFRVGDHLSIGGGFHQLTEKDAEAVEKCQSTGEAFTVQVLPRHTAEPAGK